MTSRMLAAALVTGMTTASVPALASLPATIQDVRSRVDTGNLFPVWRAQLQRMVDKAGGSSVGHVCIVGWQGRSDHSIQQAYVIWPEQHRLVTWSPPANDPASLAHETRVLDLDRDIVANEGLVNGSTYRETRAWVVRIERPCRRHGTTLALKPAGAS